MEAQQLAAQAQLDQAHQSIVDRFRRAFEQTPLVQAARGFVEQATAGIPGLPGYMPPSPYGRVELPPSDSLARTVGRVVGGLTGGGPPQNIQQMSENPLAAIPGVAPEFASAENALRNLRPGLTALGRQTGEQAGEGVGAAVAGVGRDVLGVKPNAVVAKARQAKTWTPELEQELNFQTKRLDSLTKALSKARDAAEPQTIQDYTADVQEVKQTVEQLLAHKTALQAPPAPPVKIPVPATAAAAAPEHVQEAQTDLKFAQDALKQAKIDGADADELSALRDGVVQAQDEVRIARSRPAPATAGKLTPAAESPAQMLERMRQARAAVKPTISKIAPTVPAPAPTAPPVAPPAAPLPALPPGTTGVLTQPGGPLQHPEIPASIQPRGQDIVPLQGPTRPPLEIAPGVTGPTNTYPPPALNPGTTGVLTFEKPLGLANKPTLTPGPRTPVPTGDFTSPPGGAAGALPPGNRGLIAEEGPLTIRGGPTKPITARQTRPAAPAGLTFEESNDAYKAAFGHDPAPSVYMHAKTADDGAAAILQAVEDSLNPDLIEYRSAMQPRTKASLAYEIQKGEDASLDTARQLDRLNQQTAATMTALESARTRDAQGIASAADRKLLAEAGAVPITPATVPGRGSGGTPLDRVYAALGQPDKATPLPFLGRIQQMYAGAQYYLTDGAVFINQIATRFERGWHKANPGKLMPPGMQAELMSALFRGVPNAAKQYTKDALRGVQEVFKMAKAAGAPIYAQDVDAWLKIKHEQAVLRVHPDRGSIGGLDAAGLVQAEAALRAKLGASQASVEQAGKVVTDLYATLLDLAAEKHVISSDTAAMLHTQYPHYNPTNFLDDVAKELDAQPTVEMVNPNKFFQVAQPVKKFEQYATEESRTSPLGDLARETFGRVRAAHQNELANSIIEDVRYDPRYKDIVKALQPGEAPIKETAAISRFVDGQYQRWQVPADLYDSYRAVTASSLDKWEAFVRMMNSVSRVSFTAYNPAFIVKNLAIDVPTAMIAGGAMPADIAVGLYRSFKYAITGNDPFVARLNKAGLGGGGFFQPTGLEIRAAIEHNHGIALQTPGDWKRLMQNTITAIPRGVSAFGAATEMAPRLAVAQRELRRGAQLPEAVLAARRATIDFDRAGVMLHQANALFLFLNAGVQGSLTLGRAVRRDPAGFSRRMGTFVGLLTGLYMLNRQNPAYEAVPDKVKYTSGVVMLPSTETDNNGQPIPRYIAVIPNARELSAFMGSWNLMLRTMDKRALPGEFGRAFGAILPSSAPSTNIQQGPIQPLATLSNLRSNQDPYTGQPIVTPDVEGLPLPEQYNQQTHAVMVRLGALLGQSPQQLQYMVHNIGGGASDEIIKALDYTFPLQGLAKSDPVLAAEVDKLRAVMDGAAPADKPLARERYLSELVQRGGPEERDAVLKAERVPQGGQLPVASSLVNTVYKNQPTGQLQKVGKTQAAKALGIDPVATTRAARLLSDGMTVAQQRAFTDSEALTSYITSGGLTGDDPATWKDNRKARMDGIRNMLLPLIMRVYPNSLDLTDPQQRSKYNQLVATVAGSVTDTRSKMDVLLAGYYSIPLEQSAEGTPLWDAFNAARDQYTTSLSRGDQALLAEARRAFMSPADRAYDVAQQTLRPYYDIPQQVIGVRPALQTAYDQYQNAAHDPVTQAAILHTTPLLKRTLALIERARLHLRVDNAEIDKAVTIWNGGVPHNRANILAQRLQIRSQAGAPAAPSVPPGPRSGSLPQPARRAAIAPLSLPNGQ